MQPIGDVEADVNFQCRLRVDCHGRRPGVRFAVVEYVTCVFNLLMSPSLDQTHELVCAVLGILHLTQHLGECAGLKLAMLVHF